jgi:hypothetical protein
MPACFAASSDSIDRAEPLSKSTRALRPFTARVDDESRLCAVDRARHDRLKVVHGHGHRWQPDEVLIAGRTRAMASRIQLNPRWSTPARIARNCHSFR